MHHWIYTHQTIASHFKSYSINFNKSYLNYLFITKCTPNVLLDTCKNALLILYACTTNSITVIRFIQWNSSPPGGGPHVQKWSQQMLARERYFGSGICFVDLTGYVNTLHVGREVSYNSIHHMHSQKLWLNPSTLLCCSYPSENNCTATVTRPKCCWCRH